MTNDLIQRLRDRCATSEQCLPDAPYREMLTALHGEMLGEIERLTAERDALRAALLDICDCFDTESGMVTDGHIAAARRTLAARKRHDLHHTQPNPRSLAM